MNDKIMKIADKIIIKATDELTNPYIEKLKKAFDFGTKQMKAPYSANVAKWEVKKSSMENVWNIETWVHVRRSDSHHAWPSMLPVQLTPTLKFYIDFLDTKKKWNIQVTSFILDEKKIVNKFNIGTNELMKLVAETIESNQKSISYD